MSVHLPSLPVMLPPFLSPWRHTPMLQGNSMSRHGWRVAASGCILLACSLTPQQRHVQNLQRPQAGPSQSATVVAKAFIPYPPGVPCQQACDTPRRALKAGMTASKDIEQTGDTPVSTSASHLLSAANKTQEKCKASSSDTLCDLQTSIMLVQT